MDRANVQEVCITVIIVFLITASFFFAFTGLHGYAIALFILTILGLMAL